MSGIGAFVSHVEVEKKPRRSKGAQLTPVEVVLDDAKRRSRSGDWEDAKGGTFVGMYCMCHQIVYGVLPTELESPAVFRSFARMAVRAQRDHFADDPFELASFVRWTWEREKRKNTWAQSNAIDRNRLSWKWQFSGSMVTDYRIYLSGKKKY